MLPKYIFDNFVACRVRRREEEVVDREPSAVHKAERLCGIGEACNIDQTSAVRLRNLLVSALNLNALGVAEETRLRIWFVCYIPPRPVTPKSVHSLYLPWPGLCRVTKKDVHVHVHQHEIDEHFDGLHASGSGNYLPAKVYVERVE